MENASSQGFGEDRELLPGSGSALGPPPAVGFMSRKDRPYLLNSSPTPKSFDYRPLGNQFDPAPTGSMVTFVAVSTAGPNDQVQTSPDGITWTIRTNPVSASWSGVTWGNGIFVAVASNGFPNQVQTSPNGVTWTSRTAPNNDWYGVTWGNGLFVAVANNGFPNQIQTSPDGLTWTLRTIAFNNNWFSVTYGNGTFVALAFTGNNNVQTSPDGITWTIQSSAVAGNFWMAVTYGAGVFVAVAQTGLIGTRVQTSSDNGVTWASRTSAADLNWYGVT